jgi:hypothetical protein
MENYDYLKKRVLELNLDLVKAMKDGLKEDIYVIRALMSFYIDKMLYIRANKK